MTKARKPQNKVTRQELADAYAELELKPGATLEQVKAAYRRLARALHPDRNPGMIGSLMARVNRSHQILLKHLDANQESRTKADQVSTGPHHRPAGRADMQPSVRPAAFSHILTPELETIPAQPEAAGQSGGLPLAGCRLKGVVNSEGALIYQVEVSGRPGSMRLPLRRRRPCRACGGGGVVSQGGRQSHCAVCGGRGVIVSADGVDIDLPGSWKSGQRIAVPGGGNANAVWVELCRPTNKREV